jgi:hypothetical protein
MNMGLSAILKGLFSSDASAVIASPQKGLSQADKELKKKKKKAMNWRDVNEMIKFVNQKGKVICPFCSVPVGDFMITSTQVKLQDTFYATSGDRMGTPKPNLVFKGICTHPKWGTYPPPCISVIQLGFWKNVSNTHIDSYSALLRKSTIPCIHSMKDIQIIHSGQLAVINELKPKLKRKPRVVDAYWKDKSRDEKLYIEYPDYPVTLYLETEDYKEGEIASVFFIAENGRTFTGKKEKIRVTGKVNAEGLVIIENFVLIYDS